MRRVIVVREWSDGVVYWDGSRWTSDRLLAERYVSALSCPNEVPIDDVRIATRFLNRYVTPSRFVLATVEYA